MKFVTFETEVAASAILAHALQLPSLFIAKGQRLGLAQLAQLRDARVKNVPFRPLGGALSPSAPFHSITADRS
jgi:hypothetical protein